MKRITLLIAIVLTMIVSSASAALAATDDLPDPGLTPDSPFYVLKGFVESVRLFVTFDPKDKAELATHFADVKMAELEEMVERGNSRAAKVSQAGYRKNMGIALRSMAKVKLPKGGWKQITGLGVTDDVGSGATDDAGTTDDAGVTDDSGATDDAAGGKKEDIRAHVAAMTAKHLAILEALLGKVPESARTAVEKALEVSRNGHETASQHAGGVTEDAVAVDVDDGDDSVSKSSANGKGKGSTKKSENSGPQGSGAGRH